MASRTGDLRFFNAACKLLGAVNVSPARGSRRVSEQLSQVSHLIAEMTARVCDRLERQFASCHAPDGHAADEAARWTGKSTRRPQRIVVLAGEGSGTAAGLAAMADAAEVPLAGLRWFMPPDVIVPDSSYARAWYPADGVPDSPAPAISSRVAQARADSWEQVTLVLRDLHPDLILLAGMPIVPAEVLGLARLGVLNAHNGALPGYRGMDAVAWAILCNDPITCTLHVADRRPDHGPVLAAAPVAFEPAGTLRVRVKGAQLSLLTSAARHVSNTSELPPMRRQPDGQGRQFYRLHPHLKRILDCSPYGISRTKKTGGLA